MSAAIPFILLAVQGVACWFAGSDTRAGDHVDVPSWLRRHGRRLAVLCGLLQLGLSVPLLGAATGPLLVAVAWMVSGSLFVACVNAWPQRAVQVALLTGLPGAILLAVCWLG